MRLKHFNKKLILNKKTIAHLINNEMKGIQGGGDSPKLSDAHVICPTDFSCPPQATC